MGILTIGLVLALTGSFEVMISFINGLLQVNFSMLEIYNEQVRDLLDSRSKKTGLRVRQHPKSGFYGSYSIEFQVQIVFTCMVHHWH